MVKVSDGVMGRISNQSISNHDLKYFFVICDFDIKSYAFC